MRHNIEQQWYGKPNWLLLLAPLSWLFGFLSSRRKKHLLAKQLELPVPVIVVGNITVGGTGKTPFIIALANQLMARGFRVGIISRGYGASLTGSRIVGKQDGAKQVGDEPAFIFRALGCRVAVGRDRVESIKLLLEKQACNVILSDDGLQHYQMARHAEIVMLDGERGLGNGWLLPVGPLREAPSRLQEANMLCINGATASPLEFPSSGLATIPQFQLSLTPRAWRNVATGELCNVDALDLSKAQALAGIGNPSRFFKQLARLGFSGTSHAFADHFAYQKDTLQPFINKRLLMTEKDAIKCQDFASDDWWALEVGFDLPEALLEQVLQKINTFRIK